MIKIESIYAATHEGLDIILRWCPAATASASNPKKPFVYRDSGDSEPSAYLLPPNSDHNKKSYWKVNDFGMDGLSISPLDVVIQKEGLTVYEAIVKLATIYNVVDDQDRAVCKPRIEKRPATDKEKAGSPDVVWFRFAPSIPSHTLSLWAKDVSADHLASLGWHYAEFTRSVNSQGQLVTRYSTEHYPIFVRECRSKDKPTFYKVYEPRNLKKRLRFAYIGKHVDGYINGLFELEQVFEEANKNGKPTVDENGKQEEPKKQKLSRVVICSGERDAVCCLSRGEHPVWFNSETDSITGEKISAIMRFCKQLYNIPDIDSTGKKQGIKLALRFISIKTVWLPDSLRKYNDDRGHKRKDLRDWMEMYPSQSDFNHLLDRALEAKFWDENSSARARSRYIINSVRLNYFLSLNGYYCLDEDVEEPRLIHVSGNVVEQVYARNIRRFVYDWAHDSKQNVPMEVLEAIQTSMRMKGNTLECIPKFAPDFRSHTPDKQLFFFRNGTVEVTSEAISFLPAGAFVDAYVWKNAIVQHDFSMFNTEKWLGEAFPPKEQLEQIRQQGRQVQPLPFFSVTEVDNLYEVKVLHAELSPLFSFLINSSRLYWRKELELRFEGDLTAMKEYWESHRFCIDGEGLSTQEVQEQMQNLANKIFTIGYLLHEYKLPTRAWAVLAMDNVVDSRGRCNGRSGKSFFAKAISNLCNMVELRGRDRHLLDNKFFLEQVTEETRIVNIEDCGRDFQIGPFYSLITSDMQINAKNVAAVTLAFEQSPKFYFSTNFVPAEEDASTQARILPIVFSDYYHAKAKGNDYLQDRSIMDDFGFQLMYADYPENLWQGDCMFMMQCLQFYLATVRRNVKIMPPMSAINRRAVIQNMDPDFKKWATRYFFVEEGHLNVPLFRRDVYADYCRNVRTEALLDKRQFKAAMVDFCDTSPYVTDFNPPELHTDHVRHRILGQDASDGRTYEMFFIRGTEPEVDDLNEGNSSEADGVTDGEPADDSVIAAEELSEDG